MEKPELPTMKRRSKPFAPIEWYKEGRTRTYRATLTSSLHLLLFSPSSSSRLILLFPIHLSLFAPLPLGPFSALLERSDRISLEVMHVISATAFAVSLLLTFTMASSVSFDASVGANNAIRHVGYS